MRVLTVQQPWACAIITGVKGVENRTQLWKYRGPLAIHAGARWSERGARTVPLLAHDWPAVLDPSTFPMGAILGTVDLVDAHRQEVDEHSNGEDWRLTCCDDPFAEAKWPAGMVHLVVKNPRKFAEPILDVKGALGLWTPKPDLLRAIEEAA